MTQTFRLTPKQIEQRDAAASPARHILAYGGSRSGKTLGFVRCVTVRALMAPGSRHLIARLHNVDVRQSVMMDTFPTVMRLAFPLVGYAQNKQDQFVTLPNGAEIWFGGLDDKERVEKILGKEFSTIYPNECSQIPYPTITTLRTRLAQSAKRTDGKPLALKAYYDLNPVGRAHWTYREFIEGLRPDSDQRLPEGSRAVVHMNPTDNPYLPAEYLDELATLPERERARFLSGEYLMETPGALWSVQGIDACRVDTHPELHRIVIGVDPSGSDGTGGDRQGIVAVGMGADGNAYVIEDRSCKLSPGQWGRRVVDLYWRIGADCIVAEANYGGAMVQSTIQAHDKSVKVKLVNAARGKHIRAEPIAALYEAGKVKHVGRYPELEGELVAFSTDGYQGSSSPDRADAAIWALTELMLGRGKTPGVFVKRERRANT